MGRDRPAVIRATLDDIQLITALGAMLVGPQRPGPGVERGALLIAMAIGPYLGANALLAHERIVFRYAAVRIDAHDLALQLVQILRRGALIVFAQGDEQVTVAIEDHPRAEVVAHRQFRFLAEDDFEVFQTGHVFGQTTTPCGSAGGITFGGGLAAALGVGQIHHAVLGEVR